MSGVEVAESVLRWAVKRSQKTVEEIESRIPEFRKWLSGELRPSLRQLEKFARATHAPFGYLFLREPPAEKIPITLFRKAGVGATPGPSPDLIDTVYTMQRRQDWMHDHRVEIGLDPLPFVGSLNVDSPPNDVATAIRATLGLEPQWARRCSVWTAALAALRKHMEEVGILVFTNGVVGNNTRRPLDVNEFRGFALVDPYAPLVFVNNADAKAAQMFTLAHEMAHIFFGHGGACNLRQMLAVDHPEERACDRAAAEFLVPGEALKRAWTRVRTEDDPFPSLSIQFKVSEIVAARRALDLRLITRARFRAFYEARRLSSQGDGKSPGGGDFYSNQNLRLSRQFISAVVREVKSGRMSYTHGYRITGLYGDTFDKYADRVLRSEDE